MHCLIYQKNFDCVLYPDKDVLYQLCDTEDSLDEFQEQRYTKVPPRQSPQVTHTLPACRVQTEGRFAYCVVKC